MHRNIYRCFHFIIVSLYLSIVGIFLIVTGRIKPGTSLRMILSYLQTKSHIFLRKKGGGTLSEIESEKGYCYIATVPSWIISDSNGRSEMELFENGKLIGPAHSLHEDIRRSGMGRYSHWGGCVYFSASDNSDPKNNGRTYTFSG